MKAKFALTTALASVLLWALPANAAEVIFRVRMAYQVDLGSFDPAVDFVDLAGSFNGWGNDPLTLLADADGDTVYQVTLDGFSPSEQIEFKFRINGQWDGSEEFPGGGPNRVHVVSAAADTIQVWYNDYEPNGGVGPLHWWNDAVFYEIFVRSFYDSDGDGIGDFQGLIQKLDYLNDGDPATDDDLGITGIWLMPINDAPSYHGYDALDYRSVNPDYGTMGDFLAFLDAAHDRGIRVIIDYVMNHCSDQHPWFVQSALGNPAYEDYFRWSPVDPDQTGPWGQEVWHSHSSDWYYGLFTSSMPDLNYENQAVEDEMFATATYWLDSIGVDGFRLDAVLYIVEEGDQLQNTASTLQFWHDYNAHVKSVKPHAFSIGEAWTSTSLVLPYVKEDRIDICFEFDLSYAMLGAVGGGDAAYLGAKANEVYNLYPHLQFGTFLTNHDQDRVMSVLGSDVETAKTAAGIYLMLPGVPFAYYGEEIGMTGGGDHLNIRTPMQWTAGAGAGFTTGTPWQPINGNYPLVNVAGETSDPNSLLEWYRRLIHVRCDSPALRRGTHEPLSSSASSVLAFVRENAGQKVLCLANTSPSPRTGVSLTGSAASLEPGEHTLVNLIDPADTLDITVTPAFEIDGLYLSGHEVAAYSFGSTTGVGSGEPTPPAPPLRLERNFPNPFNPETTIRYSLPVRSRIRLAAYDLAGREVAVIEEGMRSEGAHEVNWSGRDGEGRPLASGVYFLRLNAGDDAVTSRMTLLR